MYFLIDAVSLVFSLLKTENKYLFPESNTRK